MASRASPTPDPFIAARLGALRAAMARQKLPALLVTNFADVSYLTGFEGDDSFLIVTPDHALLISDSRYAEQISREAAWVDTYIRKKGILEETARLLKRLKIRTLGVQAESMTLAQRDGLAAADRKLKLKSVQDIVITLRNVKDERELALIERSIAMAEHGFESVKALLKVGMTEHEIASLLVHEMCRRGASGPSFDTIVAIGPNAALPHYRPGAVKLQKGATLLIDWGAKGYGYCSDLTRVLFVGSIPPALGEIYQIVLEAQMAAIAAIRPGKTGRQIDKIARDIIAKAGYGDKFGHGLGHGIGRDIHEPVWLGRFGKMKLQPGMVVTVEPGIYLPGVGGVRIEDDVLVTRDGCRVLTHLSKTLENAKI